MKRTSTELPASRRSELVGNAVAHLRLARYALVEAGVPKAAAKVRRALKSAEGAHRNAILRRYR